MKITLIGAAGVRTPLLVHGLAGLAKDQSPSEVAFWDIDQQRLPLIARVAKAMARRGGLAAHLDAFPNLEAALEGADIVITSIRAGGIDARIKDETIALAHGLVGQETVGAGGFACALRNLAAMAKIIPAIERVAPRATLINFTNPVGIVSEYALNHSSVRILGVCDTPLETFESIAKALGKNPFHLSFAYLGLNHLGWIRSVRDKDGTELLPRILSSDQVIQDCYRYGLFPPDFIRALGLLPTEYLYFYYFPKLAYENAHRSGQSRGQAIAGFNERLFSRLAGCPDSELIRTYENYLRERNASYFSIEATAGDHVRLGQELYSEFSGYERIAVLLLQALQTEVPVQIPLTVRNARTIQALESNDAVEVLCDVSSSSVSPLPVGLVPIAIQPLLLQVKEYERLTVRASVDQSVNSALTALQRNPLVPGPDVASAVLHEYMAAFGSAMGLKT